MPLLDLGNLTSGVGNILENVTSSLTSPAGGTGSPSIAGLVDDVVSTVTDLVDVAITNGGVDALAAGAYAGLNLDGSAPLDVLLPATAASSPAASPSGGEEAIAGQSGNDMLVAKGGTPVYILGAGGADTIVGGEGNDHLYGFGPQAGEDGADIISGGAGDDYLQGNAGADVLDGGIGADRIYGGKDNDIIAGGAGDDAVNGNFGKDTIDGGDGNDVLRGGKDDDGIVGGAGDDVISGDLGADLVAGGAGADLFRFAAPDAALLSTGNLLAGAIDVIGDFADGQDHIDLAFTPASIVHGASQGAVGGLVSYLLTTLTSLPNANDVAAVQVGSDTYLLFNGSGGGALIDSVVKLANVNANSIAADDFV